jgi:hypothetical protein
MGGPVSQTSTRKGSWSCTRPWMDRSKLSYSSRYDLFFSDWSTSLSSPDPRGCQICTRKCDGSSSGRKCIRILKKRSVTVHCAPRTASPSESVPVSSSCSRRTGPWSSFPWTSWGHYPKRNTETASSRDLRPVLKAHQNGAPPHYHRASRRQSLLRRLGVFLRTPALPTDR